MDLEHLKSLSKHVCGAVSWLLDVSVQTWSLVITQPSRPRIDGNSDESSSLHITGLGAEWPSTSYGPETFEEYIRQNYDLTKPG